MNGPLQRKACGKLDWLVVRDFQLIETAEFWREARNRRGESPETSAPRSSSSRPPRTPKRTAAFTNTQRLLQWHHKAVEPPGDCRSELDFIFELGRRLKRLYVGSTDPKDRPIQDLTWDYPTKGAPKNPTPKPC